MKLSLQKMQLLVPDGRLDEGLFKSIVAQVKASGQYLIFDPDQISEQTIRDLANEVGIEHPDVIATEAEIKEAARKAEAEAVRAKNEQEAIERFEFWLTKGDGKRLRRVSQNSEYVINWIQKTGRPVTAALVDEAIRATGHLLFWEELVSVAPAPAPPTPETPPAPVRRKFEAVTQGSGSQLMAPVHEFEPLLPEITKQAIQKSSASVFRAWQRRFGDKALEDRAAGRS